MKKCFFYGVLLLLLCSHNGTAQNKVTPHLTSSMMKEGLITMSFKDAWTYQQGDDRQWANPNFDDAAWHNIALEGLRANAMPDSLWHGYGWWRMRFTADSTFYSTVSRLHFRGWGAAEVYLDGKKISYYGTFSTDAATEKNYIPRYVVDKNHLLLAAQLDAIRVHLRVTTLLIISWIIPMMLV
jgi:hypothetical protein